jgi:hypothetical protein
MTDDQRRCFDAIRRALSPDLLKGKWRRQPPIRGAEHVAGHCYIATEAAYHGFGKAAGYETYFTRISGGGTHWWLYREQDRSVIDPTFEQVVNPFPYEEAGRRQRMLKGRGPDGISRRALLLLVRAGLAESQQLDRTPMQRPTEPTESRDDRWGGAEAVRYVTITAPDGRIVFRGEGLPPVPPAEDNAPAG